MGMRMTWAPRPRSGPRIQAFREVVVLGREQLSQCQSYAILMRSPAGPYAILVRIR
jgi:hypothetical protein